MVELELELVLRCFFGLIVAARCAGCVRMEATRCTFLL